MARVTRPSGRREFEIAVVCALTIEADAVVALFDQYWDEGDEADHAPYDKAYGDSNAYSTGRIGRHDVVVAHMPGMGKANAATIAANCRLSWPGVRLALVVGVCGVVPFAPQGQSEIILGDVIISHGVVQYDFDRELPQVLSTLGRPNLEIRSLLAKLGGIRDKKRLLAKMASHLGRLQNEPELQAEYPGVHNDRLFNAKYRHLKDGETCDMVGCSGDHVRRARLDHSAPQPAVHFGLVASGNTVMKSGEERDRIAREENIIAFEMEGSGVWDTFPCVIIKGACDYADSHKTKRWQRYAAATAGACAKSFLEYWVPSPKEPIQPEPRAFEEQLRVWSLIPYPRNDLFVSREEILGKLQNQSLKSLAQIRVSLFGLGGIGKTQIAIEYAYRIQEAHDDISVFWVHASDAERFRESYASVARKCNISGHDDPKAEMMQLVKEWLENKDRGWWLMVIDNADDAELFRSADGLGRYIPECRHVSILVTTRNKHAGLVLSKGKPLIEIPAMNKEESKQLLRANLGTPDLALNELSELSATLEHLPLALAQAAAFIQSRTMRVSQYLELLKNSDHNLVRLLSEDFETAGRLPETLRAVADTWIISFNQIQRQNPMAAELLSLMSFFDRHTVVADFLESYLNREGSNWSVLDLTEALGDLKAFSLIVEAENGTFDMHRLVQLVTRKWLQMNGTIDRFAGHALLSVSLCNQLGGNDNSAGHSTYLRHAYAVLKFEGTGSEEEIMSKEKLLHHISRYFIDLGQWKNAAEVLLEVTRIYLKVHRIDQPDTQNSIPNLARTYTSLDKWEEVEELESEATEMRKSPLGIDHPNTQTSMSDLSAMFWIQGRWEEAERVMLEVLETRKTKLGATNLLTMASMSSLAST